MEIFHMPKELDDLSNRVFNGLSNRVLSHWFPTGKNSHACVNKKIGKWRRCGRDGVQPNEDVI